MFSHNVGGRIAYGTFLSEQQSKKGHPKNTTASGPHVSLSLSLSLLILLSFFQPIVDFSSPSDIIAESPTISLHTT